jgi:transposase
LYAGIDTHKDTLAIAVIDQHGRPLTIEEVANTERGFSQLTKLLEAHHVVRVGIEGSGAFGRAVAVHLATIWQPSHSPTGSDTGPSKHLELDAPGVVEVPTLMTARERRAQTGKGKTDPVDALAIARITAREPALPPVRLTTGATADLRALLDYRGDLVAERTALTNRVHADLVGLMPGYHRTVANLSTRTRIRQVLALLDAHPAAAASVRGQLTRRRLERAIAIDAEAAQLKRDIEKLVQATGTSLTQEYGIGPLVAARLLAEVVDIRRYPTRETFAAANGTAPIPASSGRTVRHRYNPGGNRQLNRALYTVALTQIGADTEGRAYYQRKRAAGKTHREAMRCLKRRLSDVVYRYMRTDAAAAAGSPDRSPDHSPASKAALQAADAADANGARLTA